MSARRCLTLWFVLVLAFSAAPPARAHSSGPSAGSPAQETTPAHVDPHAREEPPAAERQAGQPEADQRAARDEAGARSGGPDEDDAAARDDGYRETVVVTATRTATPLEEVGSSVTVIDPADAVVRSGRLVVDALRQVPGLDVRRSGGVGSEASIFMRGADSDHTLVLVDGVSLNDPSTPSRTALATHLTLDGVERIEVLRGPQSPLYGGDALGGVINVIPRTPGERRHVSAWAEAGSYSTASGGVSWEDRMGRTGIALSASQAETGGFSSSSGGAEDDPYRNRSLAARLATPLGARSSLEAAVYDLSGQTHYDGFLGETGQRIDSDQLLVRVEPRFASASGRVEQRVGLRYASHRRVTSGDFPSEIDGELASLGWTATARLAPRHLVLFGAEARAERAAFGAIDARSDAAAVFLQDQLRLADRVSATIGARWDDHDAFGSRVTARGSLAWRPGSGRVVVRASAGSGFKAPSLAELDPRVFAGSADLRAETSTALDAGIEYTSPTGRGSFGATAFASEFDDLIVALFDAGTGSFQNANIDVARTRGVELHAALVLAPRTRLAAHYTWTDTEAVGSPARFGLADGEPLLRRPEHRGGLTLSRRSSRRPRARAALDVSAVGPRRDIDPLTFAVADAPGYVVADAVLAWPLAPSLLLRARVENLFDERYEEILGFGTPGRSAYVGLSLDLPLSPSR